MLQPQSKWPLRHISIRVPWQDNGWIGKVCDAPDLNGSCLRLPRISSHRNDVKKANQCEPVRGKSLTELGEAKWPCCVAERATFMAPFELVRHVNHPYQKTSPDTHGHFAETPFRLPAFSAPTVPFNWMFRSQMENRGEDYGISINSEREPDLGFKTDWIQEKQNQLALLDCFFGHIKPERSLCFFYAKEVPFVEDSRRVIVGVGLVRDVGEPVEYRYEVSGKLKSILWERTIQHSIRPGFRDGFLMPYHELIAYSEKNPDFDPSTLTAFAPTDYFNEFSYAAEHVSHDAAIDALQSCIGALTRAKGVLPDDYGMLIKWLHDRLSELWKMRGPCPGLGAALSAFGLEYGTFIAREIETRLEDNDDPWPLVEKSFTNPRAILSKESAQQFGETLREKWKKLPKERKAFLILLSRFNIQPHQAKYLYVQEEREKMGITCLDEEILKNPYLIYEKTRITADPVGIWTVDRGVFPELVVRKKHPLPQPSFVDAGTDWRRIRSFVIHQLEKAAADGHTLQRTKDIILAIRGLDIEPKCEVDSDMMTVVEQHFDGVVVNAKLKDGSNCYQLRRLAEIGQVIRTSILKRIKGTRHMIDQNWRAFLDDALRSSKIDPKDRDQEELARQEKAAALKELAEARFSVLIGPAGTGKTTLLSVLCSQPKIAKGEVLLLAPTGKARVRMEQATKEKKLKLKGFTIAQYLSRQNRYNGSTGRYHLSKEPKDFPAKTVIVDECSMLTEEMLAALLDALAGVERLILIGDPRQLPPIGAGRPFVDIISEIVPINIHSIFPRIGTGYAELTIRRRQSGEVRDDIQLAEWFSGAPMEPGEDEIFEKILYSKKSKHIAFKQWESHEQFQEALLTAMVEELSLSGPNDVSGFDRYLEASFSGGYSYFNHEAAMAVEKWQILSPVRKMPHGVLAINRLIHQKFRSGMVEFAQRERYRKIPKPMGSEQIVYGDKVINVKNHPRKEVWPDEEKAARYIANGEIGMVTGQFKTKKMHKAPWLLRVEFSSQPGFNYDFKGREFNEEADVFLELAYALTVHKAQGSEFSKSIVSLPNPCRLLSRELLYTALTRQRERIVILHQSARSELRKFSNNEFSETARRLTNLFQAPSLKEHKGKFYEERLIHQTCRGEMVRSKSELTIADHLHSNKVDYMYEQPLTFGEATRYPDFTIEDAETGKKIYWEHCGLLFDKQYQLRWERKLEWYKKNGILPQEQGGGPNGSLIVTSDDERGGISSKDIEELIHKVILNY